MQLPSDGLSYTDIQTESVGNKISGAMISTVSIESVDGLEFPAYIIEHNDYVTLPHSLEAVLGLLDKSMKDTASVYVTRSVKGDKILELGKGDRLLLEDVLLAVVSTMYSNHVKVYFSPCANQNFVLLKNDDLSKLRLHL